jgi:uncharacterized membrane protein AbrB (regulator of aidB expression)
LALGYPLFRKGHPTGVLLQRCPAVCDMLLFGEEAGGDVRALSLIHATRVLIVVMVLPFVFAFSWRRYEPTVGEPFLSVPWTQLLPLLLWPRRMAHCGRLVCSAHPYWGHCS